MPTKRSSSRVTREIAAWVKWLYANTHMNQAQIAAMFDLNQGRVSEIITGIRFSNVPPEPYVEGEFG